MTINNYELALEILSELKRVGIRTSIFGFNGTFTPEELNTITKLTLTGTTSLEDIEKLPNLRELNIYSDDISSMPGNTIPNINQIHDFKPLELASSLQILRILNDNFLTELDLTNLPNLHKLQLINNTHLKYLKGLDKLTGLEEVVLLNNGIATIENISDYIAHTQDTAINIFDLTMFPFTFGNNPKTRHYLEAKLASGLSNLSFAEKVSFDDGSFLLDYYKVKNMYLRVKQILRNLNIQDPPTFEDIKNIHKYIAFSLKYDYDGLDYRDKNYRNTLNKDIKGKDYFMNRFKLMNTSYAAIVNRKAVCEGYVNMMIFMLNTIGIEAKQVRVSISNELELEHTILKFKYNDEWYYADPEKERETKEIDLFAFSFEEFSKKYSLPYKEYLDNEQAKGMELKQNAH